MDQLADRSVIVTGAGGGIGRAIAARFAREGASIVCWDIDAASAEVTVKEIRRAGGQAVALVADVADEGASTEAVALARHEFGGLHVVVCNAVFDLPFAPLTDVDVPDWQRTMDVNLNSVFLLCKSAIPAIAGCGGGSIVLVASQLGRVARAGRTWYCAQKGALISLARAMALDHANQRIRVNSLSPGPVETGRYLRSFPDPESARANHQTLLGRLGRPHEIAAAALFLASEESSFMTGADLLVDGGYTAL